MPSCAGLRAHVELSKISGYIVCETFRVAPRNLKPSHSVNSIDTALSMLQAWQSQLPISLQMPDDLSHADPSCCVLHMAHNQLVLLTTRPIFFAAVKQAVAQRIVENRTYTERHSQGRHIQACSIAAHRNLLLAQRITQSSRKLLQAGMHFVFNAAVILLLNRIMSAQDVDVGQVAGHGLTMTPAQIQHESSIHFAIQTFEEEARTGTNYPRDCCRVLQDLRALTERYLASRYPLLEQKVMSDHIHASQADNANAYPVDLQMAQPALGESDEIYEEMMTWVQSDGLQLDNSLFL